MNVQLLTRLIGVIGTIVCVAIFLHAPSWPTPDKLLVFATFVFMMFSQALAMLKRLLPFVGLLLVYESFRGIVPDLNAHVNYSFMPRFDVRLFGHLPTTTLQSWWWHGHVQWYDFLFYLTYMMHFVLPFLLALVIWKVRERSYWRYVAAYVSASFVGFVGFLVFPAAPPWMASDYGFIAHIQRVSSDVWFALGVHDFPSVYNRISPNPVAAVPSLHATYSTLFALFVTALFKTRWRFLAWIYPLLIYVGTIYMGEHYAFDEITGALLAVAAFFASPYIVRVVRRAFAPLYAGLQPYWQSGLVRLQSAYATLTSH